MRRGGHQLTAEQVRRRAYLITTLGCVLVLMLVGVYDFSQGQQEKVLSSVMSGVLGLIALVMIINRRISLRTIEQGVAVIMFVGSLSEWSNILRENHATTRPYLTFLLLISVWFGLLPSRLARALSLATYLGFALLLLTRPDPDLGAVLYLGFCTVIIGIMSAFGGQIARERQESALFQQQALTYPLTGLANRRAVMNRLQKLWNNPDTRQSFALLLVDVDHFKRINDQQGHALGDEVLRKLGQALLALANPAEVVGRWGGEEFVMVLQRTEARQALNVTDRMNGHTYSWPGLPSVTISAAGAFSHEAQSPDARIELADQRLYAAKHGGRNQVRWDSHKTHPE